MEEVPPPPRHDKGYGSIIDDMVELAHESLSSYGRLAQRVHRQMNDPTGADCAGAPGGTLQDVCTTWAGSVSDLVVFWYRWVQLIDGAVGDCAKHGGSVVVGPPPETREARRIQRPVPAPPHPSPDLYPTAFHDGNAHVIPQPCVHAALQATTSGAPSILLTFDVPAGTPTGEYAGSVTDGDANIVVDRYRIRIS